MATDNRAHRLTWSAFLWLHKYAASHPDKYVDPDTDFHKVLTDGHSKNYSVPIGVVRDPDLLLKPPSEYAKNPRKSHLSDVQALDFYKSLTAGYGNSRPECKDN